VVDCLNVKLNLLVDDLNILLILNQIIFEFKFAKSLILNL